MPKRTTEEGTLRNVKCPESGKVIGFKFGVRLPRYRGNMVSLINGYYVEVDGEEFPQDKILFQINGKEPRSFEELKKAVWEHWNYQDTAYLYVMKEGGLAPGEHTIVATVSNFEQYGYNPYSDQQRVEQVTVPTRNGLGFGGAALPQTLTLIED